jgi:hypothetical protein
MEGSVARAHHSTRSPGTTPRWARTAAVAAVRASRSAASTRCAPSHPSISTGASGSAAHRPAHTSGSVRPGGGGRRAGQRPAGTSAFTIGERKS